MKERFQKLENKTLKRRNKDHECGLTKPMLIDCIEPADWMFPPLHALTLLTNTPFEYLQEWVWHRVEDVPIELILARRDHAKKQIAADDKWERVLEAKEHLNEMQAELSDLLPEGGNFETEEALQFYNSQKLYVGAAETSVEKQRMRLKRLKLHLL